MEPKKKKMLSNSREIHNLSEGYNKYYFRRKTRNPATYEHF